MEPIEEKTWTHPCFHCEAHKYARIHLPVAPRCNVSCNYCVRKFDCVNESRPGVTTKVISPQEALERYQIAKEKIPNLSVVGIAGPGDILANFEAVEQTLTLIREYDPDVTFCVSTNGLQLPRYVDRLKELGVTHVTVTVNSLNPKIAGKIYRYVEDDGIRYTGTTAGELLAARQLEGIRRLIALGMVCKVNIIMIKGVNEEDIEQTVKKVAEMGVEMTNITRMIPVKGSAFENLEAPTMEEVNAKRDLCNQYVRQMRHCGQCRADAIGTIGHDRSAEVIHANVRLATGE